MVELDSSDEDEGGSGGYGKGFMLPDRDGFQAAFDLSVVAVTAESVILLQDHQRIIDSQNAPSHVVVAGRLHSGALPSVCAGRGGALSCDCYLKPRRNPEHRHKIGNRCKNGNCGYNFACN